jgi:hypothetical protein
MWQRRRIWQQRSRRKWLLPQKAADKINEIREVTAAASEVVTALGEKSNQIGNILDVTYPNCRANQSVGAQCSH